MNSFWAYPTASAETLHWFTDGRVSGCRRHVVIGAEIPAAWRPEYTLGLTKCLRCRNAYDKANSFGAPRD